MTSPAAADANVPVSDAQGVVPWLSVRGLAKSYGGVHALRGVDLDIALGQVYGIIGPNGAGKSTLMKVLTGAVTPDRGEIRIEGAVAEFHAPGAALARGLVMMPQEMTLVPEFTVVDNILLGAEPTRAGVRSVRRAREVAEHALAAVGLDVALSTLAADLAPVQQRLLMLAKAVGRDTRVLILDEPTAGLPPAESRQVIETVSRLRDRQLAIAYVSHHLSEVATLSDHVVCVREGQITTRLSGDDITKDALVEAVVGLAPATVPSSLLVKEPPASAPAAPSPDVGSGLALDHVYGQRLVDVSFEARRGEITGLTGLLGSGIAELVAVVAGLAKPVAGEMRVGDAVVTAKTPADALVHGIGTVTGDRARSAMLTRSIRDNVSVTALGTWFGRLGLIRRERERAGVGSALATSAVTADMERPLTSLSGGNQQRVLVSRLLAAGLDVMVFDNPTVGVDVGSRAGLWRELRALAPGRIILLVSGEADELVDVCDRVVCIRDGAVSEVLDGDAITERALAHATS